MTVSDTVTAANVLAVPAQNILAARDFDAITSNTAYVDIHTANFAGGEIRGQVHKSDRDENHNSHDHDDNHDHN